MIVEPSKATLRKYGLTLGEWKAILDRQGRICPICEKEPSTGRFVVDHFHARGWKKMTPEKRKTYVRGLTCWYCNRWYMSRNMTIEKASNIQNYLLQYEWRKNG